MPAPTNIILHKQSRQLEVQFEHETFSLPAEYLRVFSPSAEVQGHHPSQAVLVINKQQVGIEIIEPVGHYAIKIFFDDKHSSGLFTWDYLYELGKNYQKNWQEYLKRLASK